MKHLLLLFLFPLFVYSQFCPSLGPDQILPCGVGSTTLTANLSQCGPGGSNPNQTTNYNCINIPYVNQTNTGTQLFMGDDTQQGPFQIGFNFCYFGQTYTQFYVGSNGWISFSPGQPTTFTSTPIPNAGFNIPKNCIMGPWQDWHPGVGGQIRYQVQGTSPCRKLVVSWINVPMFGCTQTLGTFHIVIYESSNYIENHIQSKQFCNWANGTAVQGIHNQAGTVGITVVGRNSTQWVANNDAFRWVPSGPVVNPVLTWYQVGNPNPIGTGPTITVTPPQQGASYTCHFVYPTCNAGWNTCNQLQGGLGPDTVFVQPGPPNLPPPTVNFTNPTCFGNCNGSVSISPNQTAGGSPQMTISWNNNTPVPINAFGVLTAPQLCSGTYSYLIVANNGCDVSGSVTLVDPPIPTVGPMTYNDTICYQSSNEVFSVPQQLNYMYSWSSVGGVFNGQWSNTVNIDFSPWGPGFIQSAVQVIGWFNNCPSLPLTVDLTILDISPIIDPVGPFCEYDNCITLNATPSGGVFNGMNVWLNQYCPNNGFIGVDSVGYEYTQSGCVFDTSIYIQVFPTPSILPISNGIVDENNVYHQICDGDSITDVFDFQSQVQGLNEWYVFGDTINHQILDLTWYGEGIYTFEGVRWENGCVSNPQSFIVTIDQCPNELIYIPNAFTPNGDERNNTFKPIITSGVDVFNYSFVIYNRWGEIIWESFNPSMGWDGTYNNIPCQDGTYTWILRFKVVETDEIKEYMGNLTLMR